MAITTLDGLIGAAKQRVVINKTASVAAVATNGQSVFAQAGNPGAGTLAGTSTTTGVLPTDATAGCPVINAFGGGATGYISRLEFSSTVACRIALYDVLGKYGAYSFNASTTGNTPVVISSRIPGGTDYTGLELWYEQVTAGTLVQNVAVTYTDNGNVSRTTGTVAAPAAMILGRMFQLPLAAGTVGIRGITGVVGTVASAGTFNLLILRPLGDARIRVANDSIIQDALSTGLPVVYADSAFMLVVTPDAAATGLPEVLIDVANA
jgi:hypothetical protein